jgi:integrase
MPRSGKPTRLPVGIECDPRNPGRYRVRYSDQNGRRCRAGADLTLRQARDLLAEKKREVRRAALSDEPTESAEPVRPSKAAKGSEPVSPPDETALGEFISLYLDLTEGHHRDRGGQIQKAALWSKALGSTLVSAIGPEHMQQVIADRARQGKSPATLNRDLAFIRRVLNVAIDHRLIDFNPCRRVKPRREDNRRERFLTPEEECRLLAELDDQGRAIVTVAMLTGARRANVFGLRWENVDLPQRRICFRWTKSGRPYHVPMTDTLIRLLAALPSLGQSEWVFPDTTGRAPMKAERFYVARFVPAVRRAGLKGFRFHDLRHTTAARLVMAGVDLVTVKELLGHRSIATTERYAHLSDAHKRAAMARLDSGISAVGKGAN